MGCFYFKNIEVVFMLGEEVNFVFGGILLKLVFFELISMVILFDDI